MLKCLPLARISQFQMPTCIFHGIILGPELIWRTRFSSSNRRCSTAVYWNLIRRSSANFSGSLEIFQTLQVSGHSVDLLLTTKILRTSCRRASELVCWSVWSIIHPPECNVNSAFYVMPFLMTTNESIRRFPAYRERLYDCDMLNALLKCVGKYRT